ncbi:MAG TPA: hypothetical protein VIK52_13845 [Opitutaceae bacterium]
MGALFLACGVLAWCLRPNRWTAIFLLYGFSGGIHWGGAVGAAHAATAMSLFFVYLSVTALGDAALLHLVLIYPKQRMLPKWVCTALYLPAAAAALLAATTAFAPKQLLEAAAGILLLVANLFSLAAGILFLVRFFTTERQVRLAARLPLIAAGVFVGSIVALLGASGLFPGEPESWNLALGVIPVTLAIALVSHSPGAATRRQDRLA